MKQLVPFQVAETSFTDFKALTANAAVCARCAEYLRTQKWPHSQSDLVALTGRKKWGEDLAQFLLKSHRTIPLPLRSAVIELLADRSLDPFVRLWLATRPMLVGSWTLRRYANRLAVLAYSPLQRFSPALEAIRAMRDGALDVARMYAIQAEEALRKEKAEVSLLPSEEAICKAFHAAMHDVPYEAVVATLGWLIDAHEAFGLSEGRMMRACSRQLRILCARLVRMGHLLRKQEG